MTTLRQAAQQALEALESFLDFSNGGSYPKYSRHKHPRWVKTENAITTLREALAQPEQEPVAWLKEDWTGGHLNYESVYEGAFAAFPVYKHPPAAQPEQEPTPWRDMVVATLVREGVNKHKARELADHFAAQRSWQGLTDDDRFEIAAAQHGWEDLLIAAEAKLKERNG